MYMMSVNRAHKASKLTPASNAKPLSEWLHPRINDRPPLPAAVVR
jgi:hypothetical protein